MIHVVAILMEVHISLCIHKTFKVCNSSSLCMTVARIWCEKGPGSEGPGSEDHGLTCFGVNIYSGA